MNLLLKIVSVLFGVSFLVIILMLQRLYDEGTLTNMYKEGGIAYLSFATWIIDLALFLPGALFLWMKRRLGVYLVAIVCAKTLLYHFSGAIWSNDYAKWLTGETAIINLTASIIVLCIVLSPSALRLTSKIKEI